MSTVGDIKRETPQDDPHTTNRTQPVQTMLNETECLLSDVRIGVWRLITGFRRPWTVIELGGPHGFADLCHAPSPGQRPGVAGIPPSLQSIFRPSGGPMRTRTP